MNYFVQGAILLLLSALGFGLLPIFALYAYEGRINTTTLLFLRFIFTALVLFSYGFFKLKRMKVGKKDLLFLFLLGGIGYNLQSQFYFSAVKFIPASLAALFLYTYPAVVTVLSFIVDREKLTKEVGASLLLSFLGLIMILGNSIGSINGLGILLALGAALVYSLYIIVGNRVVKRLPPLLMSAYIALFSSLGVFGVGLMTNQMDFTFAVQCWLPIAGLIMFSTVIAMLFFFRGMELVGPAKASIISMMEPVFTVVLSTVLFHDRLAGIQMAGGILVLAGAVLVIVAKEKKVRKATHDIAFQEEGHNG